MINTGNRFGSLDDHFHEILDVRNSSDIGKEFFLCASLADHAKVEIRVIHEDGCLFSVRCYLLVLVGHRSVFSGPFDMVGPSFSVDISFELYLKV